MLAEAFFLLRPFPEQLAGPLDVRQKFLMGNEVA